MFPRKTRVLGRAVGWVVLLSQKLAVSGFFLDGMEEKEEEKETQWRTTYHADFIDQHTPHSSSCTSRMKAHEVGRVYLPGLQSALRHMLLSCGELDEVGEELTGLDQVWLAMQGRLRASLFLKV